MSSYTIPSDKMQAFAASLRPEMIADPKFAAECQRAMVVTPEKVVVYLDRSSAVDPRLHKAAVEFGTLN